MRYLEASLCVSYLRAILLILQVLVLISMVTENVNFVVNTFHFRKEITMLSEN